mmetsp:Transcript_3021/g.4572  ORF Transcript_3021/g.4572 Transcript_3021/m.4572 type:complete len:92 (+) Transcript_3021:74-349(+)
MVNPRCATVTVELPASTLGLAFSMSPANNKPMVSRVADDSPLKDLVYEGYVYVSIESGDGATYENFTPSELSNMITDTAEDPFRKMTFYLA